jgi:hypothetical protein
MMYPAEVKDSVPFDRDRDFSLMERIAVAIQRRIGDSGY